MFPTLKLDRSDSAGGSTLGREGEDGIQKLSTSSVSSKRVYEDD